MPWLETAPVDERERFIADYRLDLYTITDLCARYNVSRKTGYKWVERRTIRRAQSFVAAVYRHRAPYWLTMLSVEAMLANMLSRVLPIVAIASLIARAGAGQSPAQTPATGTFDFTANTPKGPVRGMLQVVSDTVLVEPQRGVCRSPDFQMNPNLKRIRYECIDVGDFDEFTILVDRQTPLRSSWSASFKVDRQRRFCVEHDQQGACIRMGTETVEETDSRGGKLLLIPRASTPP